MSFTKQLTLTALLSTLPLTAFADNSGLDLDSVVIRDDVVTVDYSNNLRTCGLLLNSRTGAKVQPHAKMFCEPGRHTLQEVPLTRLHIQPGDELTMCAIADLSNCTDPIEVRIAGDLDGDNDINIIDLQLMHASIMGEPSDWWPAMQEDEAAADLNGDGVVNVIDILMLIEALWGDEL